MLHKKKKKKEEETQVERFSAGWEKKKKTCEVFHLGGRPHRKKNKMKKEEEIQMFFPWEVGGKKMMMKQKCIQYQPK